MIIKNLSKVFSNPKVEVLNNFNLEIRDGEFVTFFGPNGCGKSTLLRILAGLENYEGEISWNKRSPKISMVFQDYRNTLLPWRTVKSNLNFVFEINKEHNKEKLGPILDKLDLLKHKNKFSYQLSGGQQQKLSLARAFLTEPDILLLDEPFSALDFDTARNLRENLLDLWEQSKTTTIFVSHDLDEAIFLGDKVVVLSEAPMKVKRIIEVDLPRPRNQETMQSLEFARLRKEVLEALK